MKYSTVLTMLAGVCLVTFIYFGVELVRDSYLVTIDGKYTDAVVESSEEFVVYYDRGVPSIVEFNTVFNYDGHSNLIRTARKYSPEEKLNVIYSESDPKRVVLNANPGDNFFSILILKIKNSSLAFWFSGLYLVLFIPVMSVYLFIKFLKRN